MWGTIVINCLKAWIPAVYDDNGKKGGLFSLAKNSSSLLVARRRFDWFQHTMKILPVFCGLTRNSVNASQWIKREGVLRLTAKDRFDNERIEEFIGRDFILRWQQKSNQKKKRRKLQDIYNRKGSRYLFRDWQPISKGLGYLGTWIMLLRPSNRDVSNEEFDLADFIDQPGAPSLDWNENWSTDCHHAHDGIDQTIDVPNH